MHVSHVPGDRDLLAVGQGRLGAALGHPARLRSPDRERQLAKFHQLFTAQGQRLVLLSVVEEVQRVLPGRGVRERDVGPRDVVLHDGGGGQCEDQFSHIDLRLTVVLVSSSVATCRKKALIYRYKQGAKMRTRYSDPTSCPEYILVLW